MSDSNVTRKANKNKSMSWRQFIYQMSMLKNKLCLPNQNRDIFLYVLLTNSLFDIQKCTLTTIRYPLAIMKFAAWYWLNETPLPKDKKEVVCPGAIVKNYYEAVKHVTDDIYKLSFSITSIFIGAPHSEYKQCLLQLDTDLRSLQLSAALNNESDKDLTDENIMYLAVQFAKEYLLADTGDDALRRYQETRKKYIQSKIEPQLKLPLRKMVGIEESIKTKARFAIFEYLGG